LVNLYKKEFVMINYIELLNGAK